MNTKSIANPWLAGLYAALYSAYISTFTIASAIVATGWALGEHGGFTDWPTFVTFMSRVWFAGVIGLVFQVGPYARAKQAASAAAGGNTLPPPEQNQPAKP